MHSPKRMNPLGGPEPLPHLEADDPLPAAEKPENGLAFVACPRFYQKLKEGAHALPVIVVAAGLALPLLAARVTPCMGARQSMRLEWQRRQELIDAQLATTEDPDHDRDRARPDAGQPHP